MHATQSTGLRATCKRLRALFAPPQRRTALGAIVDCVENGHIVCARELFRQTDMRGRFAACTVPWHHSGNMVACNCKKHFVASLVFTAFKNYDVNQAKRVAISLFGCGFANALIHGHPVDIGILARGPNEWASLRELILANRGCKDLIEPRKTSPTQQVPRDGYLFDGGQSSTIYEFLRDSQPYPDALDSQSGGPEIAQSVTFTRGPLLRTMMLGCMARGSIDNLIFLIDDISSTEPPDLQSLELHCADLGPSESRFVLCKSILDAKIASDFAGSDERKMLCEMFRGAVSSGCFELAEAIVGRAKTHGVDRIETSFGTIASAIGPDSRPACIWASPDPSSRTRSERALMMLDFAQKHARHFNMEMTPRGYVCFLFARIDNIVSNGLAIHGAPSMRDIPLIVKFLESVTSSKDPVLLLLLSWIAQSTEPIEPYFIDCFESYSLRANAATVISPTIGWLINIARDCPEFARVRNLDWTEVILGMGSKSSAGLVCGCAVVYSRDLRININLDLERIKAHVPRIIAASIRFRTVLSRCRDFIGTFLGAKDGK